MIQASIFFILVGLLSVIEHPSWILRAQWISHYSEKAGLHWDGLQIDSSTPRFLEPSIRLSWRGFTLHMNSVDVNSDAGVLSVGLSFRHFPPRLREIGPAEFRFREINLHPVATQPDTGKDSSTGVPSWARFVKLGRVVVDIDHWRMPGDTGSLRLRHEDHSSSWNWVANESGHRISAALLAQNPGGALEGPWFTEINAQAKGTSKSIQVVRLEHCKINLRKIGIDTDCPLAASFLLPQIPREKGIKVANTVHMVLEAHLRSSDVFDLGKRMHVDSRLKLTPMDPLLSRPGLVRAWGEVRASGDGIPAKPVTNWKTESTFDLELGVKRFQKLVRILDPTNYAVPAPLHALDGSVQLSVQGKLDRDLVSAPIRLVTRLNSENQNLDLDISASWVHSTLDGIIQLTNIKIPLPHVDYQKLPQLVPDSRIARSGSRQQAGTTPRSPLEYHFKVKTTDQPIQIVSNLTKSPIPIRLDIDTETDAPIRGKIHFDSFPLDLFRRNAKVERVDIEMTGKENRLSGVVSVDYSDYLIHMILAGTVEEPEVKFVSEPELSDQDVISVLLFGRTSGDLDADQGQSVGNVRSAASSRALDLASLYLLASTPIESVGYDPASGTFSAKFRIAEGLSLNVAEAQSELESIGVRKRIGSHWAIVTQYGNPADPSDKSVSTLLQWSHRY